MLGALEAILGHRSAHSLATGPFTVEPGLSKERESLCRKGGSLFEAKIKFIGQYLQELSPFISPLLLTITPALSGERERSELCTPRVAKRV